MKFERFEIIGICIAVIGIICGMFSDDLYFDIMFWSGYITFMCGNRHREDKNESQRVN